MALENDQMRQALEMAKAKLQEQDALLQKLTTPPLVYATVLTVPEVLKEKKFSEGARATVKTKSLGRAYRGGDSGTLGAVNQNEAEVRFDDGDREWYKHKDLELEQQTSLNAVLALEGKIIEVDVPTDKKVSPGDVVKVVADTMQIVDVAQFGALGEVALVQNILAGSCEVDYQGDTRVVFSGRFDGKLKKGDRVVLDSSASVIVENFGKKDDRFAFVSDTGVTWDNIGGLEKAKKEMREVVEYPYLHADVYSFYGKRPVKGVLLYGPPGCGKTMLGKATATAVASLHGRETASTGFIYVKGPEILDRYVGVAEATIRGLFARARDHKAVHGYPAVIFIDEADAILGKRGSGISSDIERTIVPMFLTEMDGLEDSGALILLATNRSDILDPAVVRDGRIDRKVKIDRPNQYQSADIFKLYLKGVPLHNGYSVDELAEVASAEVFSLSRVLYHLSLRDGEKMSFMLGHVVNGGMITGIVDQATSIAMERDVKAGKPSGLARDDLVRAVDKVLEQNRDLNHHDDLEEFAQTLRNDVVDVRKAVMQPSV